MFKRIISAIVVLCFIAGAMDDINTFAKLVPLNELVKQHQPNTFSGGGLEKGREKLAEVAYLIVMGE